jgi:hypothetical protein
MSSLLEAFARRTAKRTTRNGRVVLVTDGDPLLVEAFTQLGWADPYEAPIVEEAATVTAAERAVLPRPQGRG